MSRKERLLYRLTMRCGERGSGAVKGRLILVVVKCFKVRALEGLS